MKLVASRTARGRQVLYMRSQKNEGWVAVEKLYDDGGFSGANMDRPVLKLPLVDIAISEVN